MSPHPVPRCVLNIWPDVPAGAWQWDSPLRLRAPHQSAADVVWLVVVDPDHGHAMGRPVSRGDEQSITAAYAGLRMTLMRQLARELACHDATPVRRPDGRCIWCGSPADSHHTGAEVHHDDKQGA